VFAQIVDARAGGWFPRQALSSFLMWVAGPLLPASIELEVSDVCPLDILSAPTPTPKGHIIRLPPPTPECLRLRRRPKAL